MRIAEFPKFGGEGRTASFLDEELILLGNDGFGTKGSYITIQRPRDGLLAMKYTINDFPLKHFPHQHASLVSRNSLAVLGGKFKSRALLSKYTWTELPLFWNNGSRFYPNQINSCDIKLAPDLHIIFGGGQRGKDLLVHGSSHVLRINTTDHSVSELQPLTLGRLSHSCQLVTNNIVLVSGGLALEGNFQSLVQRDELYNITSQQTVQLLEAEHSLRKFHHTSIRLGDKIYAFGGMDSNNGTSPKIAAFDAENTSWYELSQELHSTNTSELVVSNYPSFSLDCVRECDCGIRKNRIFDGSETEV